MFFFFKFFGDEPFRPRGYLRALTLFLAGAPVRGLGRRKVYGKRPSFDKKNKRLVYDLCDDLSIRFGVFSFFGGFY